MKRKQILIIAGVSLLVALAGCGEIGNNGNNNPTEELGNDTNRNVDNVDVGSSYWFEIKLTEKNQQNLVREQPPVEFETSLERQNLIQRYRYLNDESNTHHVYLVSETGQVMAYYVAQGKVSSVNSKLTNDQQIVEIPNAGFDGANGAGGAQGPNWKVVESPQMDGSYGTNGDAIFFFTASDGAYVEWNGIYLVSEEPRNLQSEPVLVQQSGADYPGASGNASAES